ncbi:ATP phosphoribosyltransferase [Kordiimonas sediminis]|uniref:ATP phosphoribosyltransferase n=1 Tax=Kordiimonas sediminis TaxID=1735581 RepID=A0A919ANY0_9PROT|nr:ATP phosphoribosyltransferase [Kordiimonas sediminis]GHF17707.1 ATP phosphoribosyltransferase [Kordiimonas sediminis]
MQMSEKLVLALPKGRILGEVMPLVNKAGIIPEAAFDDPKSRQLEFKTNIDNLTIIRVRAFDAATFVAFGAAQIGVVGNDVLQEFGYDDLYAPLDLNIGHCRLSLAMPVDADEVDPKEWSHIRVATKYPNLTRCYYASRGVQAECIKLNGAMELAPSLGLCNRIVDLVSTGSTLKANNLKEVEVLTDITSRLVISRPAFKTRPKEINYWIDRFKEALKDA